MFYQVKVCITWQRMNIISLQMGICIIWVSKRTQTHLLCSFLTKLNVGYDHVVATVGGRIILWRQNPGRYRYQCVVDRQGECQAVFDSISVWNISMQLAKQQDFLIWHIILSIGLTLLLRSFISIPFNIFSHSHFLLLWSFLYSLYLCSMYLYIPFIYSRDENLWNGRRGALWGLEEVHWILRNTRLQRAF